MQAGKGRLKLKYGFFDYLEGKLIAKLIASDKFGYKILEHWFNGLGEDLIISDNPEWNEFMLNNRNFRNRINEYAHLSINDGTYRFNVDNVQLHLGLDKKGEGDYKSGYGLINGANTNYGGFCVNGNVTHIGGNRYKVVANYEFNDYVDPGWYPLDIAYVVGSWAILGVCLNYKLQISGTVEYEFEK